MNNKYEACRNCPIQCMLENGAKKIVDQTVETVLTEMSEGETLKQALSKKGKQVRAELSVLSQQANASGCPSSEINRVRGNALGAISPAMVRSLGKPFSLGISSNDADSVRPSFPLGFQNGPATKRK